MHSLGRPLNSGDKMSGSGRHSTVDNSLDDHPDFVKSLVSSFSNAFPRRCGEPLDITR